MLYKWLDTISQLWLKYSLKHQSVPFVVSIIPLNSFASRPINVSIALICLCDLKFLVIDSWLFPTNYFFDFRDIKRICIPFSLPFLFRILIILFVCARIYLHIVSLILIHIFNYNLCLIYVLTASYKIICIGKIVYLVYIQFFQPNF